MGGCLSYKVKLVRDEDTNTLFQINVTRFPVKSIQKATNNFSSSMLIRQNGYSKSYNGILDGTVVTVKAYDTNSDGGVVDFTSMIKLMSGVRHQNVVELIGYCIEDDHRILVHEFGGDYTLAQLLFSNSSSRVGHVVLDWPKRVSICHGIARAIDYLHNGINPRVVLRDVNPSNVLIDCSLNPRIVDFEFSCHLEDDESDQSGELIGTCGYVDPEYCVTRSYSEKTDVYAFGITLLEIIHGKRINMAFMQDHRMTDLVNWTKELQRNGSILEIVDPTLSEFSEVEVTQFVNVALSCIEPVPIHRPSMSVVRLMLSDYDFSRRPDIPVAPMWSPEHSCGELSDDSLAR